MNETTKNLKIKFHGWHDVTLTGNMLTGDTFAAKDFIKKNLGGVWDGRRKGWTVDLKLVDRYLSGDTLMVK